MISCTDAVRQLWEYLENEVSATEREAVEEHLAFCRRCCGEVEFADELRGVLASAADNTLPRDVEARLVGVLDALDEVSDDPNDDPHRPSRQGGRP